MDSPYKVALAQRDKLAGTIAKLEQRLTVARAEYQRAADFISSWEHFSGLSPNSGEAAGAPERQTNPSKEEIAGWAIEIIDTANRPLSRAEVYDGLMARGVVLHGKDPVVVLSTMLWRMRDAVPFIKGVGYWPSDRPLPPQYASQAAAAASQAGTSSQAATTASQAAAAAGQAASASQAAAVASQAVSASQAAAAASHAASTARAATAATIDALTSTATRFVG